MLDQSGLIRIQYVLSRAIISPGSEFSDEVTTGIDLTTIGDTTLWAAGSVEMIANEVSMRVDDIVGTPTVHPVVSIGNNVTKDNVVPAITSTLTTIGEVMSLPLAAMPVRIDTTANAVVAAVVTPVVGATTFTVSITIRGVFRG